MKYVYIVTRIVSPSVEGITEVPNLGAHSNLKSASVHFDSVIQHRAERTKKMNQYSDKPRENDGPGVVLRRAYIHYDNHQHEELRLERWTVRGDLCS